MAFNENDYNTSYKKANYDRLNVLLPKGSKTALQSEAAKREKSVNALITEALEKQYGLDLSKKK